jgi:hypothetical protein
MLFPFADALPSALRKLKWDNDSILFTDGSAKDGKAGAGVALLAPGAPVVVKQRLRGNRTSLAAELAGIARAAEIANDEDITAAIETGEIEGVVIASDCDVPTAESGDCAFHSVGHALGHAHAGARGAPYASSKADELRKTALDYARAAPASWAACPNYTASIEGVVIASDCDVAITLIENAMCDDTSMCGAPEEDKLREAVANMKKLKGKTTLIKVRGHVGITGNEAADEAAKAAREMDEPDSDSDDEHQPAPAQICVALKTDGTVSR